MTSGIMDFSKALPVENIADVGDVPTEYFSEAENKLSGEIARVFEKSRSVNCDLFGIQERIVKYEKKALKKYADDALKKSIAKVSVRFENVR